MWLMIEALDVWMFRDGKPFDSGAGHVANSLFPPTAFTLQGMLRSLAIDRFGVDWDDFAAGTNTDLTRWIGAPNASEPKAQLGQFQLRGPFLAKRIGDGIVRYFPLPADVVQRENQLHVLPVRAGPDLNDATPDSRLWLAESKFTKLYRRGGQFAPGECLREDDLFVREQRFGNAIDATTRTVRADEGLLYSANFIRPRSGVGLLVNIGDGNPWRDIFPDIGEARYFKLGGEGRAARIERVKEPVDMISKDLKAKSASKLVLITPAYFTEGTPRQEGITARAIARSAAFGGWDLAKRRPRPIRRYTPPGSVFIANAGRAVPNFLTEQPANELPLATLGFGDYLRLSIED